ncbi:MAG: S26 family signal peptidase, partial [Pseudomonadota bacterium]
TIHATDRKGRMMPVLPDKCRRLNKREYLLISVRTDRSFDSRYFGPVKGADILGAAEFIGSSVEVSASDNREKGGARGPGAQGKIKERGTNLSLSHCLHIDFYSTNWSGIVPKQRLICIGDGRLGWYYFTIDHERSPRPGW